MSFDSVNAQMESVRDLAVSNSDVGVYASYQKIFLLAVCLLLPSILLFPMIRLPARNVAREESAEAAREITPEVAGGPGGKGLAKPDLLRLLLIQGLIGLGGG